jgi:hypothetical protein
MSQDGSCIYKTNIRDTDFEIDTQKFDHLKWSKCKIWDLLYNKRSLEATVPYCGSPKCEVSKIVTDPFFLVLYYWKLSKHHSL